MAFTKKQVGQILDRLRDEYPEAGCALEHKNKYELIICSTVGTDDGQECE